VPAGYRAVLTCITAVNTAATAAVAQVSFGGWFVWTVNNLASGESKSLTLRAVAYAGENYGAYKNEAGLHILLTGYLFHDSTQQGDRVLETTGPTQEPPPGLVASA
jgi:hypothetical protein